MKEEEKYSSEENQICVCYVDTENEAEAFALFTAEAEALMKTV